MAGEGKTGEPGGEHEANGPESEPSAPSSRGRRALLAAGVAAGLEESEAPQPGAQANVNAARLALEREVHRFQVVGRQERLARKKSKQRVGGGVRGGGKGASATELTSGPQLGSGAGRQEAVAKTKSAHPLLTAKRAASRASGAPGAAQGPFGDEAAELWGDAAFGRDTALRSDPALRGDAASGHDAALGSDDEVVDGDVIDSDAGRAGDAATLDDSGLDGSASAKAAAQRRRRKSKRLSANSVATRLLLPVLAAEWEERVAEFKARGHAPPKPYRPTDFQEAFDLTAAERQALAKDQIRHLNTSADKIVERALRSVTFIDRWRDAIAQGPANVRLIDLIDTLARALSHADTRLSTTHDVAVPEFSQSGEMVALTEQQRLERLLRMARDARRGLLSEVKRLIDRASVPRGVLSGLKGRAGHFHAATDVLALVNILEGVARAGTHVTFTPEELRRYTSIAQELIHATSHAPGRHGSATRVAAIEERSRAFTLLWVAHREAYWGLAGIFKDRLDVSVVLPSLVG